MNDSALLVAWTFAALILIWLGYAGVIAGLAVLFSRRRRQGPSGDPLPLVSVIVATRESDDVVALRLSDLLSSEYPADRIEVVVGLDGRDPCDTDLPSQFNDSSVRFVAGDGPGGKAVTLNAAVRIARGEILVFADAHQRFERRTIRELVDGLSNPDMGAVSGRLQTAQLRSIATPGDYYWRFERWLRAREARLHSTVGVTGAVFAMRRALWSPLPAGLILDDVFTPMRLVLDGHRIGFVESACATDERRFTPSQEYRRKVRTLTGVLQLCAWLPAVLIPWRNPIWAQFVFHKLLRLLTPYLVALALLGSVRVAAEIAIRMSREALALYGASVALLVCWPYARRRLSRATGWFVAIQAALVVSMANGLRGRWDVWR